MKFDPYGTTTYEAIPWCASVPDFVVRWLAIHFGDENSTLTLRGSLRRCADEYHMKLPRMAAYWPSRGTDGGDACGARGLDDEGPAPIRPR